jgi:GNAT superfamily N-acetyltransferase
LASELDFALQADTCVVPAHRGRRLGMWLKTTMLQWLLAEEPRLLGITAWNASANEHMLRINVELGFRPAERWHSYQARIDANHTDRERLSRPA